MTRRKAPIDKGKLKELILKLEKDKKYENRQELYTELANQFDTSITTISNRIKTFGLIDVITTPIGQRGNKLLNLTKTKGPRKNFYTSPDGKKHIAAIKNSTHKSMHPVIDRAAKGSLKAAVKLKCWECSGEQKGEIKHCEIIDCALWPVRPYK